MAVSLHFEHNGWDILTAAWTAAKSPGGTKVSITYQWGSGELGSNDTGNARIDIPLTMDALAEMLVGAPVVLDLRPHQAPSPPGGRR